MVRGSLVRIFGSSSAPSASDDAGPKGKEEDKWWEEWLKDAPQRRNGPSFNNTHPDNLDPNAGPGFGFGFGNVGVFGAGPLLAILLPLLFGVPVFAFGGNLFGGGGGGGGGGGPPNNRATSPLTFILLIIGALFVLEVIFSSGHTDYYDEY